MRAGGQAGNKNATKNKPWSEAIYKFSVQNPDKREKIIEKLFEMAAQGNMQAIKEIMDRVDGKALQAISVNDADDIAELPTEALWERLRELKAMKG